MYFYLEVHVFGAVLLLFVEKMKFLYFQVFPWHFYFMRGHSLVGMTEHDDSAADIIVHSIAARRPSGLVGKLHIC